jgi:hypothetical protein
MKEQQNNSTHAWALRCRPLDCSAMYFGGLTGLQFQDHSGQDGIERAHQPGRGRR